MTSPKQQPEYQNNPFFVASDGLTLLFRLAQSVAILLVVLCGIGFVSTLIPTPPSSYQETSYTATNEPEFGFDTIKREIEQIPAETWIIIGVVAGIILLGCITIGVILGGISDYTASQIAAGKTTSLGQAFKAIMRRFFGYLWLQILVGIKIFLWSLLLIVPGIIMATRYSLAGTAFFSEKLGAQAATKRSAALTKGAWFTTFGSMSLFNIITFGIIQPLLQPGINGILFRQYAAFDAQKLVKPKAHILSWIAFFAPIVLVLFLIGFVVLLALALSTQFS